MAGDWIKMRLDLADDPAVVRMAATLDLTEDEIVGKLHRLWAWADRHTVDGSTQGISGKWVDRYLGRSGFADAMVEVGWLVYDEKTITFPNFDKHNGASAKKRGEATVRKRLSRQERDNHVTGCKRDSIPKSFVRHVLKRDQYTCVFCGTKSSPDDEGSRKAILSIDHLIPATRGGKTVLPNLVCCCKLCNAEKNDRTPEEFDLLPTFLADGVTYVSQQICDKSVTREEKRRREKSNTPLPPELDSPRFQESWIAWEKHRAEKHKSLTPSTRRLQLQKLAELGQDRAIAAIEHSITQGYQGIFEPNDSGHKNGKQSIQDTIAAAKARVLGARHEPT